MVGHLLNILMEHNLNILMIFCHKIKMYNFDPYSVLLNIAKNIAVLLMTASVLQGHICIYIVLYSVFCTVIIFLKAKLNSELTIYKINIFLI